MKSIQNKQLIGIIGIFIFTLIEAAHLYGQSYDQSLLLNKEWKYQEPGKTFYFSFLFTDKEEIVTLFTDGVKSGKEIKSSYYLSNETTDKFQSNLVGKSKIGKYIVIRRKGEVSGERLVLYEILKLTDTTLKIRNLQSGSAIVEYTAQ